MFQFLRKYAPIVIVIFLVGFVLTGGITGLLDQGPEFVNAAAVINGEEVSWQAFNNVYDRLLRAEYDKNPDVDLPDAKREELKQSAWQQVLIDRLLMQEVERLNITVSDAELYEFMKFNPPAAFQQDPNFQTEDGRFNYQLYLSTMSEPQYEQFWAQVEPTFRVDLMKQKVQQLVLQAAHVTEAEAREFFMADAEQVTVEMINVDYNRFSKPPPKNTDEEKMSFFEENKSNYDLDERAQLNVVILEKKPSQSDVDAAHFQARELYDSVMAGADFAELAKAWSQDPSAASNSGDLGWFARGQMVDEFDRAAFTMEEGEISEPIRTQFGWHVIKHMGYKEEMDIPRGKKEKELVKKAHCAHILIKIESSSSTIDNLFRRLTEFGDLAKETGFFEAAEELDLPVKTTTPFFKDRNIQHIGNSPEAHRFAFNEEVQVSEISPVLENRSAVFIAELANSIPAGEATYEEAADKVNLDLLNHKVSTTCNDTAAAIWAELQAGTDFAAAAKKYGEEIDKPDPFKRGSFVKGLNRSAPAIGAAFGLTKPGEMAGPVEHAQGTVIFRLVERTTADLSAYEAARDSIWTGILYQKQQALFGQWMQNKIEASDIVNNVMEPPLARNL